jgi:two-component system phosphate regulon sensor histidine kinase PhoR
MPDYQLGIQLKGETIEDLVQKRTRFNIWLIVIMDLILILAAWFVYRGVRQQLKLAQIKSEFVSNVSHEIRTPLAVINMYSETLEMGRVKDEEKKKEYYRVINTEANRLSGIVNKILNFSKIESGKREYKFEETDLNEVIEQIIETYQHHFKNKGFVCEFKPGKNIPLIKADKEAITDAAINLIDNAMKYSEDKKQIEISTVYGNRFVSVEVKDYGIGIDVKDQKLVFEKFHRVTKGNLAHKAKGSGIGLSIVKHIMDAHQGEVDLVSTPGKGSRFILNFPLNS